MSHTAGSGQWSLGFAPPPPPSTPGLDVDFRPRSTNWTCGKGAVRSTRPTRSETVTMPNLASSGRVLTQVSRICCLVVCVRPRRHTRMLHCTEYGELGYGVWQIEVICGNQAVATEQVTCDDSINWCDLKWHIWHLSTNKRVHISHVPRHAVLYY